MSDALSAISLLLAAFTVLFGLWQPAAAAALAITPMPKWVSRGDQIAQVRGALLRMAALLVISFLVSALFAPRAFGIVTQALSVGGAYDDLRAAFAVAEGFLVALFLLVLFTVGRLGKLFWKVNNKADIPQK